MLSLIAARRRIVSGMPEAFVDRRREGLARTRCHPPAARPRAPKPAKAPRVQGTLCRRTAAMLSRARFHARRS